MQKTIKETIAQIVEDHQKIVNHFFILHQQIDEMAEMIVLLGLRLEDVQQQLQEKSKNNTLQTTQE